MKALALITEQQDSKAAQWQFDKVMAAIAYDLDLTIVFLNHGIQQLQFNQAWKCLNIYGVTSIYAITEKHIQNTAYLIDAKSMNIAELKNLISKSEFVL